MECDGMLVENITNYWPHEHIKMHPPGVPTVNCTGNDTLISWNASSPRSDFIQVSRFQIAIKQKKQSWKAATILFADKSELRLPSWKCKGHCKVRVRVMPADSHLLNSSHWSNWSPVTSWQGAPDVMATSEDQRDIADKMSVIRRGVLLTLILSLVLIVFVTLVLSKKSKRLHQRKPVPNPSKYFHTLHSVYEGNLKKWLNPLSAPESFFTAQPCDLISPVELCDSSDVARSISPSSSSTSALLHLKSYSLAGWDTSGVADNSSSSSSCFSNMGYFMSSTSGSTVRTDPNPAYFTYQDEFHNLQNSHKPHLSLCPSTTITPTYESLRREPQSPDSGFGIGEEDEEGKEDKIVEVVEGAKLSYDHLTTPLLILPLHLPSQMCPPSSPPPPPIAPSLPQVCSDSQQVDTPVEATGGSYAAWPLTSAMCRSSSMPVETCKTGYLTLKELQTTFSNKSI